VAAGRKANAAASDSQKGSKRRFLVIILGIPCLFLPAQAGKFLSGRQKGGAGRRWGAALPTVQTILTGIWWQTTVFRAQ
jgi:hypothetical protein